MELSLHESKKSRHERRLYRSVSARSMPRSPKEGYLVEPWSRSRLREASGDRRAWRSPHVHRLNLSPASAAAIRERSEHGVPSSIHGRRCMPQGRSARGSICRVCSWCDRRSMRSRGWPFVSRRAAPSRWWSSIPRACQVLWSRPRARRLGNHLRQDQRARASISVGGRPSCAGSRSPSSEPTPPSSF